MQRTLSHRSEVWTEFLSTFRISTSKACNVLQVRATWIIFSPPDHFTAEVLVFWMLFLDSLDEFTAPIPDVPLLLKMY